jgi:hypothetical protein
MADEFQSDADFVGAVRSAAAATFQSHAGKDLVEVYLVLAEELRARGITPDADAVFDGARLISQSRPPAVLAGDECLSNKDAAQYAGRRVRVDQRTVKP